MKIWILFEIQKFEKNKFGKKSKYLNTTFYSVFGKVSKQSTLKKIAETRVSQKCNFLIGKDEGACVTYQKKNSA